MTAQEYMARNSEICTRFTGVFADTFHVSLRKYWHNLFGFDIVKFDDEVVMPYPEGVSLKQHVTEQYGQEAADLIDMLIEPFCFLKES